MSDYKLYKSNINGLIIFGKKHSNYLEGTGIYNPPSSSSKLYKFQLWDHNVFTEVKSKFQIELYPNDKMFFYDNSLYSLIDVESFDNFEVLPKKYTFKRFNFKNKKESKVDHFLLPKYNKKNKMVFKTK